MTTIAVQAILTGLCVLGQPPSFNDGILAGGADPTIVAVPRGEDGFDYYVASTGRGIRLSHSQNLKQWRYLGRVFDQNVPDWAQAAVPQSTGIWAPDLSYHDGLFYLYYSVSSFGSQRSVIGLAVNKTLDQESPDYQWTDRGMVIESAPGTCDFNAIDPALFVDRDGSWYLFWGSFWSGLKAIALDPQTGKPKLDAQIQSVAARPRHETHAIEAPFVIHHQDFYYLFASWDRCCDGADSDYKVVVGRAKNVLGPYQDAEGRAMLEGGGTVILENSQRWRGPGHNSVLTTAQGQWIVHHTYDIQNLRAQRVLQIRPLTWTEDGWPQVGEPIFEPPQRRSRTILKKRD